MARQQQDEPRLMTRVHHHLKRTINPSVWARVRSLHHVSDALDCISEDISLDKLRDLARIPTARFSIDQMSEKAQRAVETLAIQLTTIEADLTYRAKEQAISEAAPTESATGFGALQDARSPFMPI